MLLPLLALELHPPPANDEEKVMMGRSAVTRLAAVVTGAFTLCLATGAGHAAVVLSNFDETDLCAGEVCYGTGANFWGAQKFTTDDRNYTLDTVDLLATTTLGSVVGFYSDDDGPDQQIGSWLTIGLGDSTSLPTYSLLSFKSDGSITLSALTSYWLVFYYGGLNGHFQQTESLASSGPFTLNDMRASTSNAGFSWTTPFSTGRALKLKISATQVSEPGTIALFSIGLAGLGLVARRRHSRTR